MFSSVVKNSNMSFCHKNFNKLNAYHRENIWVLLLNNAEKKILQIKVYCIINKTENQTIYFNYCEYIPYMKLLIVCHRDLNLSYLD